MKKYAVVILLFCLPVSLFARTDVRNKEKILVISSYSPLKEGGNHIISSFEERISSEIDIPVRVEYMDSESYPGYNHWLNWLNSLFQAYEERPSVIVLIGEEVWSAYRKCCMETWKDIPVVLGGVKKGYIDYENWENRQISSVRELPLMTTTFGDFNITGYYTVDYLEENFRLIKELQPGVTDIAFCYDDRYHHQFLETYLDSLADNVGGIDLHYWVGSQLSTAELIDSVASMGKNSALLLAGWYTDVNNYSHAYSMLQNELNRSSDKFIYGTTDQDFAVRNYIGGYYVSGKNIGYDLADLTFSVLSKGIGRSPVFARTPSLPEYHLNHGTFVELGLKDVSSFQNIEWYNITPSIWEKYAQEILIGIFLFSFILVILIFVFVARWKKEQSYIHSNQRLQDLLRLMPNMAIIFGPERQITDIVNPRDNILFGIELDELIGLTLPEVVVKNPEVRNIAKKMDHAVRSVFQDQKVCSFDYKVEGKRVFYNEVKIVPFEENKVICFVQDVTSRVKAEQEVLKWKTFFQSVIDHLPVGVFVKDAGNDFRYVYFNQGLLELCGESIVGLGKNDFELNDALAAQYLREDEEVLGSVVPLSFQREMVDEEGERHWTTTTKSKLINSDGSIYIIAIVVDMTDIRNNDIELENTRNELSIALDAGTLSAWNYDVEKQWFTSLYRETVAQSGLTYLDGLTLAHPDDREKYRIFMEELSTGKSERKKEVFRFNRTGKYEWFETHAIGVYSPVDGKVFRVVGTEKNITDVILEQIRLEENRFKTQLVIKSNGIVQWDYDVLNQLFSSPDENSFLHQGISKEQFFTFVNPEDVMVVKEALEQVLSEKTTSLDIQIRMKWGEEERWSDIHGVVFRRDEKANIIQITGLKRDITEWKRITEELILLRDKAEESSRLKTAFLANMSHEIRTPLNAIVGFSNLVAHTEDPVEIEEYCRIIETNNELLLQLINDILDLSKIEAEQLEFIFSDVELNSLFTGLKQVYQMRVKEGIELICEIPEEDQVIYTERNRLTQVISNFLTNSCKFTSQGCIKLGYERIGCGIRFYVSDTGKGIEKKNIPHVFDRFTKFDAFVQGTGLGLSICQTIVRRLGGEIGVESEIGKGSTFWFILPVQK